MYNIQKLDHITNIEHQSSKKKDLLLIDSCPFVKKFSNYKI